VSRAATRLTRTPPSGSRDSAPVRPPGFFYRPAGARTSVLYCDDLPLSDLAERYGTPLYVYSASAIKNRLEVFDRAFDKAPHTVCYSVKANSNLSILRLLAGMGCGFDVVSGGELERVLVADKRAARKVVFSGVGKTAAEMKLALKAGILLFNVESEPELDALAECAGRVKMPAPVALRVNPDVSAETHPYISTGLHQHKFGVPVREAPALYQRAGQNRWLRVGGVSVHIGSQITDVKPFTATMERVAELVQELRKDGLDIRYVDAGGGLGINYEGSSEAEFDAQVREYAKALLTPLRGLRLHLLLEPGRAIVGPAGVLVTRAIYRKTNNSKNFLIVDAAMNDLLRPSLYNAYHQIVPLSQPSSPASDDLTDIVGPVCETGDFFARDRKMPAVGGGDLLAILDAGAYGMALASNYNTRGRAAEILVEGKSARVIRRRESFRDMVRNELPFR